MPRKSASKKQRGGSLASNRVMRNLDTAAATHDYVVSPRIRTKSRFGNTNTYQLTGGACGACGGHKHAEGFRGCGATAPTQSGGARRRSNKSGKSSGKNRKTSRKSSGKNRKTSRKSSGKNRKTRKTRKQRGGKNPPKKKNSGKNNTKSDPADAQEGTTIKLIQQEIYKPTNNNNKSNQKGGGSAWMASQYSQSLSPASHARSSQFSSSAPASRNTLMNPPNMGLAGSGLGGIYDRYAPAM